jgi:hypothetical protein
MTKIPMRADKAISLLDGLVEQLHYFYGNNDSKFRKHVLKDAIDIENLLKDLSINKKDTFKRIAKRYESYYRKKQEAVVNTTDSALNDSIRNRYKKEIE